MYKKGCFTYEKKLLEAVSKLHTLENLILQPKSFRDFGTDRDCVFKHNLLNKVYLFLVIAVLALNLRITTVFAADEVYAIYKSDNLVYSFNSNGENSNWTNGSVLESEPNDIITELNTNLILNPSGEIGQVEYDAIKLENNNWHVLNGTEWYALKQQTNLNPIAPHSGSYFIASSSGTDNAITKSCYQDVYLTGLDSKIDSGSIIMDFGAYIQKTGTVNGSEVKVQVQQFDENGNATSDMREAGCSSHDVWENININEMVRKGTRKIRIILIGNNITGHTERNGNQFTFTYNYAAFDDLSLKLINDTTKVPTITQIQDQVISVGEGLGDIPFTIADEDTPLSKLVVTAVSSNQTLISDSNIHIKMNNGNGTIILTPKANQIGQSDITVTVSDGIKFTQIKFILQIKWTEGTRYEAENAVINGANIETNIEGASGESQVGNINSSGRNIEFLNIPACTKVLVHYASEKTGTISTYLNNIKIKSLSFNSTGAWSGTGKYNDLIFDINAPSGGKLKFKYDAGDNAINIDYIEIRSIPVSGVTLNETTLNLTPGGTAATLAATIMPNNAANKNVVWTSSDPKVATVENGVVTPVSEGTTTITVVTVNNSKTASCEVTVKAPCPITYRGAQKMLNSDGTYDILFLATIDTLDADDVGFIFSRSKQVPIKGQVKDTNIKSTTKVYNSVNAIGTNITAESQGGKYIIACTVKEISENDSDKPLYARAFLTKAGETKYTEVYTVTAKGIK